MRPLIGRWFNAADTVAAQSVILSYDLWQTQFGGDARVLGQHVELDGTSNTVIGVMPPEFRFPTRDVALWTPLAFTDSALMERTDNYLEVVGRLRDGATLDGARAELNVIATRLRHDFPKENEGTGSYLNALRDDLSARSRLLLLALCGAALCILLLACANLANLLLAPP